MQDVERFIAGFERFRRQHFDEAPDSWQDLVAEQRPRTLLIGCSDSRVDPALLLGSDPGEIFTVRNVANLVPRNENTIGNHGVSAAIQFAVDSLLVERVIVLGHSSCGGIGALISQHLPQEGEYDFIGRWVSIAEPARLRVMREMPDASLAARRRACEMASILVSLKNLMSFPWVQRRVEAGELTLHGWYFDMKAGALLAYSRETDTFEPLGEPRSDMQDPTPGTETS
ncbi:carbonic anhydrase [Pigmentiphaga aceris]|uniref:Carbonic anhydrase n=1 Tax=Pigmentiphaga aceris TaxID=1940612 RepID=A0A5C0AT64_9BURK|nr:carbonic anhydrase [Pigmentiphaga aceris]QEI04816.1 carbonic anhydrase [Pigmentiphaga aceris]